ncbi:membrane protein CcdC involved in cytochrome C biogenesis [Salinicoccus kekensis]|uniref:Membrane protein CcdC involved in cytochrome C biogenesis n=2 Tax=Salinicoccus kekensis TaxID=714307 RepID=A0A285U8Y2_9STAP|nr:CcdC protein domain-containing protein [Salinicoccus kekensis]SOC38157.1 membrane protein CcdC involved in cytochrome C biogenesis [Salinicoccus kekensis]
MLDLDWEMLLFTLASIMAVFMGIGVIFVRQRASARPLSLKKIVIPPVMMSTGALMYVFPYFRLSGVEILEALIIGLAFSLLLVFTTRYEEKDDELYVKPSKWFIGILFGLLILRLGLKSILSLSISPGEIGGMFFLLAFIMIVVWRLSMLVKYRNFKKQQAI